MDYSCDEQGDPQILASNMLCMPTCFMHERLSHRIKHTVYLYNIQHLKEHAFIFKSGNLLINDREGMWEGVHE